MNFADFQFTGLTTDGTLAIFWPDSDAFFTMTKDGEIFEQSDLPVLYYLTAENLFYASLSDTTLAGMSPSSPFFNPDLSSIPSPFLSSVDSLLNPSSPDFDPLANFYLTISPDVNFIALTDSFTKSGSTGATDMHFVASVPEPSTLAMLFSGLAGLWLFHRRRMYQPRRTVESRG